MSLERRIFRRPRRGRGASVDSRFSTRSSLKRFGVPLLIIGGIIGTWELVTWLRDTPTYVLPRPSAIVEAAWGDRSTLASELGQTLLEAVGGFGLAAFVAIVLAVAVQRSRAFEITVLPWIIVLQAVPIVAVTPIIALIVGRNTFTSLLIAAIIAFFPITVNTVRGLRSVSDESLELMHVIAAPQWRTFQLLRLPASLPYMFVGLRVAASIVVPGAMIAEWITAFKGLGFYIIDQTVAYRTELVWAGILVATLAGICLFTLVTVIERRVISWHASAAPVTS